MAQVCGEIARGGVKEVQGVPVHDVHHARPVPEEEVGRGRHGLTASDASGRDGALPVNRGVVNRAGFSAAPEAQF